VTRWPALPASVEGAGGPIRVRIVRRPLIEDGVECLGVFRHASRTIVISAQVKGRQRWHTFYHELTHSALTDSGPWNSLTEKQIEALCDAVATQRVRERFG
jgi:hypothetical protein